MPRAAKDQMESVTIKIDEEVLSDGSYVFNVVISSMCGQIVLHAYDVSAARRIASDLENIIAYNTCDTVRMI